MNTEASQGAELSREATSKDSAFVEKFLLILVPGVPVGVHVRSRPLHPREPQYHTELNSSRGRSPSQCAYLAALFSRMRVPRFRLSFSWSVATSLMLPK